MAISFSADADRVLDRLNVRDDLYPIDDGTWAYTHAGLQAAVDGHRTARAALKALPCDDLRSLTTPRQRTVDVTLFYCSLASHGSIASGIGAAIVERMTEWGRAIGGVAADGYLSDATRADCRELSARIEPLIVEFFVERGIREPWFFDVALRRVKAVVRPQARLVESIMPIGG